MNSNVATRAHLGARRKIAGPLGQKRAGQTEWDVLPTYRKREGVHDYLRQVHAAPPMRAVEIELTGVASSVVVDLASSMGLSLTRMLAILNVPKSTGFKKIAVKTIIGGNAGQALVAIAQLLHMSQHMIDVSTSERARNFNTMKWLGHWLEQPQPSLGGHKPSDLINTPTGVRLVFRTLGAILSGAYQ